MIEDILIRFLEKKLGVPVFAEEPEEPEESYVIIERTGGGKESGMLNATIAVQSYGESMVKAALLNEKLKKAMQEIDDQSPVSKVKLNTDYNFTDTNTKRYRYQAVYDLVYYQED